VDSKDKSKKKRKGDSADNPLTAHQRELAQDESIDPLPFRFELLQLPLLFDRKDVLTLVVFEGIDGISRGLGTHAERGLMTEPSTEKARLGAGEGVSNRHDPEKALQSPSSGAGEMSEEVLNISWTEPSGNDATPTGGDHDTPHSGTMGDRRTMMKSGLLALAFLTKRMTDENLLVRVLGSCETFCMKGSNHELNCNFCGHHHNSVGILNDNSPERVDVVGMSRPRSMLSTKRRCLLTNSSASTTHSAHLPHNDDPNYGRREENILQCVRLISTLQLLFYLTDNPHEQLWTLSMAKGR